jgi:hypothetical protein
MAAGKPSRRRRLSFVLCAARRQPHICKCMYVFPSLFLPPSPDHKLWIRQNRKDHHAGVARSVPESRPPHDTTLFMAPDRCRFPGVYLCPPICLHLDLSTPASSWHMCVYCRNCAGGFAVDCAYIRVSVRIFVSHYMRDMLITGYLQRWGNPCPCPPPLGVVQVQELVGQHGRSVRTRTHLRVCVCVCVCVCVICYYYYYFVYFILFYFILFYFIYCSELAICGCVQWSIVSACSE